MGMAYEALQTWPSAAVTAVPQALQARIEWAARRSGAHAYGP
jgi:hypothetical protein